MESINFFSPKWLLFEVMEIIKFVILLFCSGKSIEMLRFSNSAKSLYFLKFFEKKASKAIFYFLKKKPLRLLKIDFCLIHSQINLEYM